MDITGIAKSHQAGIQKLGKKSFKKEWKLPDSLREKIIEYAREDAAQNVYMGNKFLALRKSEVAKVAPNRSALMGKVNQAAANMKEIREADVNGKLENLRRLMGQFTMPEDERAWFKMHPQWSKSNKYAELEAWIYI